MASKKTACTKKQYNISSADLPLSCPMKGMEVWDAHPKVYLPIEETGEAECPYCSAQFTLINEGVG